MNIYTIKPTQNSSESYYKYMINLITSKGGSAEKFIKKEKFLARGSNGESNNGWTDELIEVSHVFISKLPNDEKIKVYAELENILERGVNDIDEIFSIRTCDDDIVIINYYTRLLHILNIREYAIDLDNFYYKK